jgi:hypothetical protein
MNTTIYQWNSFDECKPEDEQIIIVQHIHDKMNIHLCQYDYQLGLFKLCDRLPLTISDYKWTNLDT